MGIVHETSNIYTDLTAWQNLMLYAQLYDVPESAPREAGQGTPFSNLLRLRERKDDKTNGYSKGMKRRLTLAMGLINDPRLIFPRRAHHPASTSSPTSSSATSIRDLNAKGVTVFLTTHNIEEANLTCDRVAIINRGMIAAIDSPEKLKGTIQSVQSVEVALDPVPVHAEDGLRGIATVSEVRKTRRQVPAHHRRPPGRD